MKTIQLLQKAALSVLVAQLLLPATVFAGGDDSKDIDAKGKKKIGNVLSDVDQKILDYEQAKGPALPLHTLEGTGGILITPVAYLSNPGLKDDIFGRPSASLTYVGAGEKSIQTFAATETLIQRVELGFSASRFYTGSLSDSVTRATGGTLSTGRDDVALFNLSARGLVIPENSFDLPLPAITVGATLKVNDGISQINHNLNGALTSIGYSDSWGVDYTITATKAIPKVFDRTLLLTAGVRFSKASQLGYVGFGEDYGATFEGNIAYSLLDWLWLAAEYRQKDSPYSNNSNSLVRPDQDWYTVGLGILPSRHTSVTVGYGYFGNVLDTQENGGWAFQFKYEL